MPDQPDNLVRQTLVEIASRAAEAGLRDFLLIGGNAVIAYGVPRFTRDVDFVIPEEAELAWRTLLDASGFELIHGTPAFAQFQSRDELKARVDLMVVDGGTWAKLFAQAREDMFEEFPFLKLAAPEHLIAMKLKAVQAQYRRSDSTDWSDIVELTKRLESISIEDDNFRKLVVSFGNEDLWSRLVAEVSEVSEPVEPGEVTEAESEDHG